MIARRKGNAFELRILKELKNIDPCAYSPRGSGNSYEKGDIVFRHFVIECKHHRRISRLQLREWCRNLERSSHGRLPRVVFMENNRKPMICHIGNDGVLMIRYFEEWIITFKKHA